MSEEECVAVHAAIDQFKKYYGDNVENFKAFSTSLLRIFEAVFSREKGLRFDARVKQLKDCLEKIGRKYKAQIAEGKTGIELITDVIGTRIVCLYNDDVDEVVKELGRHFSIIPEFDSDKIASLEQSPKEFGYRAKQYVATLNDSRNVLSEYDKFRGLKFEVQVRTITQDAWATVEHRLTYKKTMPVSLSRRMYRLAAMCELIDFEFLDIREEIKNLSTPKT